MRAFVQVTIGSTADNEAAAHLCHSVSTNKCAWRRQHLLQLVHLVRSLTCSVVLHRSYWRYSMCTARCATDGIRNCYV